MVGGRDYTNNPQKHYTSSSVVTLRHLGNLDLNFLTNKSVILDEIDQFKKNGFLPDDTEVYHYYYDFEKDMFVVILQSDKFDKNIAQWEKGLFVELVYPLKAIYGNKI